MIFPFDYAAGRASRDAEVENLRQQAMLLREAILAVCCDPEGFVCICGSDGDRKVLQDVLDATKEN